MSRDDASDFKLRAGRIRHRGARVARGERMYVPFVAKALQAAAKANGGPLTAAQLRGDGRASGRAARPRKGRCCRVGRGQVRAEGLKRWKTGQRASGLRLRRAVVKARIVRLRSGSKAADAHVRYLQRDGVTRDGQRGRLYGPDTDDADGHAFVERGREDRHQFRFIVAPEDGEEVRDLREFTRDLMTKMEDDLGTRLDWVAVDHFNTGHPHSHVLVRGKDHLDKDLVIAQDYITDRLRIRAEERLTQELGLVSDLEHRQKLERAIKAERFTVLGKTAKDEKLGPRCRSIVKGGKGVATRTLGLLGAIFAWGQENGYVGHNPVRGVKRFADQQKKALLTGEQYCWLAIALQALDAKRDANGERMHSAVGLALIRCIALTGARRGECQNLQWDEVDANGTCLALGETKTGPSLRPLSRAAFAIIEAQPVISDYVFPAGFEGIGYSGLSGFWKTVQRAAHRLAKEAAAGRGAAPPETGPLDGITLHSLRHSFAGIAESLGATIPTIAALLGHRVNGVTGGYILKRVDILLVDAVNRVADHVVMLMRGEAPTSNVVQFVPRGRRAIAEHTALAA